MCNDVDKECKDCKYYEAATEYFGLCRRYPPVLDVLRILTTLKTISEGEECDDYADLATEWWAQPVVYRSSTCGEWKRYKED